MRRSPLRLSRREKTAFKWRAILLPTALVSIGFLAGLSLLHAVLIAGFSVPPLPEDVLKLWFPMFLPWVVILGFLRRRLKLLRWYREWFTGALLVWILIVCPGIISQHFVADSVGSLTRVARISEIGQQPATRFWTAATWAANKQGALRSFRTSVSGKHSETFNIVVTYAVPLVDSVSPAARQRPSVWLGLTYERRLNNSSDSVAKQRAADDLGSEAARKLADDDFRWVTYFSVEGNTAARRTIVSMLQEASAPSAPLLKAHTGRFEDRTGRSLPWALGTYAVGFALWCGVVMLVKLDPRRVREWQDGDARREKSAGLSLLVPRPGYMVTPLLLFINAAVWLVMASQDVALDHTSGKDLISWGAAYRPLIVEGEVWRLFTASYVHANLLHVANNLAMLVLIGSLLEQAMRAWWYAAVYVLTGLIGISVSVVWHPDTVIVGASAAIFGLAGYGVVYLYANRRSRGSAHPGLIKVAALFLGINVVIGVLVPGIDLVAHVAGFAAGCVIALCRYLLVRDGPVA